MDKSLLGSYDIDSLITVLSSLSTVFEDERAQGTIERLQTVGTEQQTPSLTVDFETRRTDPDALSHLRTGIKERKVVRFDYINAKNELTARGTSMSQALEACLPLQQETLRYSVDEFAIAFNELAEQYRAWFRSQGDLEQTIVLENPYAGTRNTQLAEIVLQVVNHGTYHRGNVSTMLRQLGHASVMNDYSLYWYQGPTN
ncbi:unnamed protein product [Aphanomyces euteiches]